MISMPEPPNLGVEEHPSGRPGLRPHIRLLRASRPACATTDLLPCPPASGRRVEAGLTSKPHRDQSTRSRLTWAVSPAAGIGLPELPPRYRSSVPSATTDPDGCHTLTVAGCGLDVRTRVASCLSVRNLTRRCCGTC